MPTFFLTGHVNTCPAAHNTGRPCGGTCERVLFQFTGVLALIAGSIELLVGFLAASSFAVADAVHALTDAFTDFYGARTARRVRAKGADEYAIRRATSRVIAAALVLATIPIATELVFHHGNLIAPAMMVAGGVPLTIHLIRWHLFREGYQRDKTATRVDLIRHARTDVMHSGAVLLAGTLFYVLGKEVVFAGVTAENIDSALTGGLIIYMFWQAWKIGSGSGHVHIYDHDH